MHYEIVYCIMSPFAPSWNSNRSSLLQACTMQSESRSYFLDHLLTTTQRVEHHAQDRPAKRWRGIMQKWEMIQACLSDVIKEKVNITPPAGAAHFIHTSTSNLWSKHEGARIYSSHFFYRISVHSDPTVQPIFCRYTTINIEMGTHGDARNTTKSLTDRHN